MSVALQNGGRKKLFFFLIWFRKRVRGNSESSLLVLPDPIKADVFIFTIFWHPETKGGFPAGLLHRYARIGKPPSFSDDKKKRREVKYRRRLAGMYLRTDSWCSDIMEKGKNKGINWESMFKTFRSSPAVSWSSLPFGACINACTTSG